MIEHKRIDGVGPKVRSRYEHRLIPNHLRQRQVHALADVVFSPIGSLNIGYPAEPIPPSRSDAWSRSEGLGPIQIHIGRLQGDSASLEVDYVGGIWITHRT